MTSPAGALLRARRGFTLLWLGQSLSAFGSEFTGLSIPFLAVVQMHASPVQIGYLSSLETVPFLVFAIALGVWVDRLSRRTLLIATDAVRCAIMALLAFAALERSLAMPWLYASALVLGLCTVVFDVAYQSFLCDVVRDDELVTANGLLEWSQSTASISGAGLAGLLIQRLGVGALLIFDAVSYFASSASIAAIRAPEQPADAAPKQPFLRQAAAGLRFVWNDRTLRGLLVYGGVWNLALSLSQTVQFLYLIRTLRFSAGEVGIAFSVLALGSVTGAPLSALFAPRLSQRAMLLATCALRIAGLLAIGIAGGAWAFAWVLAGQFVLGFGGTVFNIHAVSLRQSITPKPLLGRVNSTMRAVSWGIIPLGALAAGYLGEVVPLREVFLLGVLGNAAGFATLFGFRIGARREPVPQAS